MFSSSVFDPLLWTVTLGAVLALIRYSLVGRKCTLPLPPGPSPLPIVGNIFDLPREDLARQFREISNKYGEIVHLKIFGQSLLLIGSYQVACELLNQRSANYSDRPKSIMVELVGGDWSFAFRRYGPTWRRHRRAFHSQMNREIIAQYQDFKTKVARNLLVSILESPHDLAMHIKFAFVSTAMRVVYGVELHENDDEYFKIVNRMVSIGADISVPGRFPVEALHALRFLPSWLPGGGFKRWAADTRRVVLSDYDHLYDTGKAVIEGGTARDSMVTRLLGDASASSDGQEAINAEEMLKDVTATTFIAGAETSHATIEAFFLAMALYPEVQRKAQAELDIVVGSSRLPEFSDRESLPYLNALLKELMRWHVAAPLGGLHCAVSDDVYKGCLVPGGATIMVNAWAISRDRDVYPDPEHFNPDRFLVDGRLNLTGKDPADYVFGFGRRICPGRHFSEASLFILCASLLWAFDISGPVDKMGKPVPIQYEATSNTLVSHVPVHNYSIIARSPQTSQQIKFHASSTF